MDNTKIIATRSRKRKPSQGLGDTVEKITEATGIKKLVKFIAGEDCGCAERKEKLNKLFPYNRQPQCMTEDEYYKWGNFRASGNNTLSKEEADMVAIIWNRIFQTKSFYRPCSCSPKSWQKMIDDVNKIYNATADAN